MRDWQLGLARSLLATEEYKEAVALFDSLIAEAPDDPTLWMLQANAYLGVDEPLAAAVNLEAVRMMGKAQNSSLVLLGDIYMNAGMYELAKNAYLEVIRSDQGARSSVPPTGPPTCWCARAPTTRPRRFSRRSTSGTAPSSARTTSSRCSRSRPRSPEPRVV